MKTSNRLFLFILLPAIAPLLYPPGTLIAGLPILVFAFILLALLGVFVWRGRNWALTLMIFIQGLNVINHLMMFFAHAKTPQGEIDILYIVFAIASVALSTYLVLRLDRVDVRVQMVV
jgi:hypothetical protein